MNAPAWFMTATLAGAAALSLDALPAPVGSKPSESGDLAATALDRTISDYARGSFRINKSRHFTLVRPLSWQPIVKPIRNRIEAEGGVRIDVPWNRPGYDLIEVFKLKDGSGLVVAMEYAKPPAKARVVGYYSVSLKDLPTP